jgi:hypothetical protein
MDVPREHERFGVEGPRGWMMLDLAAEIADDAAELGLELA